VSLKCGKNYYNKMINQKIDSASFITRIKNINQIKFKLLSSTSTLPTNSTQISLNLSSSLIDQEEEKDNKNSIEAINFNNNSRINATLVERVYLTNKFYPDSSK
jgi:hypothetical protein